MSKKTNLSIKWITHTAILLAILIVFQMLGLPQYITGPIVNFILLWAVMSNGILSGVLIGLISPLIAFSRGILPAPLGPMIPFIILGNIVLVIVFGLFRKKNSNLLFTTLGIVIGSILKYLILVNAVKFIVSVPILIAQAMGFPQLLTALIGGVLLLVIEIVWKKSQKKHN